MTTIRLILSEVRHRPASFALALLAVLLASGLYVSLTMLGRASFNETKRLMRELGFNFVVLPSEDHLADYWTTGVPNGDMPEEYIGRLADTPGLAADHYVGMLQRRVEWDGMEVYLTGILAERRAVDSGEKAPMGMRIQPGTCYVGYAVARELGLRPRDRVELLGHELRVETVMREDGSKQDVTVYAELHEVQEMLGMEGRINAIQALRCLECLGRESTFADVRNGIASLLPDVYVYEIEDIATARTDTRRMVSRYVGLLLSVTVAVCVAWVGLLFWLNVGQRWQEIGILRAIGFGSGRIAALFIGKAALLGVVGGCLGFALGTWLAVRYGPDIFTFTAKSVRPDYGLLWRAVLGSSAVAVLAGLIPTLVAVLQDPAKSLTKE